MFVDHPHIARAISLSPYLARLSEQGQLDVDRLSARLDTAYTRAEMLDDLAGVPIADFAELQRVLRQLRRHVLLRVMVRDLCGLSDLDEVMHTMTVLAETALHHALVHIENWQQALFGIPVGAETGTPQSLIVVGMGKLGGEELNVSSDIDLIFVFAEEGETTGTRKISNFEYFVSVGKQLIRALNDLTPEGFVFRVDMRLRPYGDSGPLVSNLEMLENYYLSQGRPWERYAWIKGRVVAGDASALQNLASAFVYRKYLDYGVLSSMRELKTQIMQEVSRRDMQDNIKLGSGGIREIEFIAQAFQLIRGGRDSSLRVMPTQQVLTLLAQKKLLSEPSVQKLQAAYVFLRNLEHRLQYLDDQQTQILPEQEENRIRIAQAMGFADWSAFCAELQIHRQWVEQEFAETFALQDSDTTPELPALWNGKLEKTEAIACLQKHHFHQAEHSYDALMALQRGSRYQSLSGSSKRCLGRLIPQILHYASECHNADVTLLRMLHVLESIGRRASYLALLSEYPEALHKLVRIVSKSQWLTDYLARYPVMLDELLHGEKPYQKLDFERLATSWQNTLQHLDGDVEQQMNEMRHFKQAQIFHLALQELNASLDLPSLSDYLSLLADVLLQATLNIVWQNMKNAHRLHPRVAVIGYGKLGGKELGYGSDLDLVFLYEDDSPQAGEIYARYVQRICSWLNTTTASGMLYETDLRLRPDGHSGLLVSDFEVFRTYQQQRAWLWELQALSRARFCAGDATIGARFEAARTEILCQPRDQDHLCTEVRNMRLKILANQASHEHQFDVKHGRGGMVDIEFIVQYWVLAHAWQYPELAQNDGNIALIHYAGHRGLIDPKRAADIAQSYQIYREEQHRLWLLGDASGCVDATRFQSERAQIQTLWQEIFEHHDST